MFFKKFSKHWKAKNKKRKKIYSHYITSIIYFKVRPSIFFFKSVGFISSRTNSKKYQVMHRVWWNEHLYSISNHIYKLKKHIYNFIQENLFILSSFIKQFKVVDEMSYVLDVLSHLSNPSSSTIIKVVSIRQGHGVTKFIR